MDTSAFVTYGNKTETKRVHFAGPDAPDKISRGSQSAIARDTPKICGFVPKEHEDSDAFWRTQWKQH